MARSVDAFREESSSFRDHHGFVFFRGSTPFRLIRPSYQVHYEALMSSGLYDELVKRALLIPHQEVSPPDGLSSQDELYKVIQPDKISFISYPYEWCFSQLKDAALLTLEVQKTALKHGMTLKDASAFNVQWISHRPVFIDSLSFQKYEEGQPWPAYKQFCEHFLGPLALMKFKTLQASQMMRFNLDGIPLNVISALLPKRSWFDLSFLIHIHLHALSQRHLSGVDSKGKSPGITKAALLELIEQLEGAVRKLSRNPRKTEWTDYYQTFNYSSEGFEAKKNFLQEVLKSVRPERVLDLGTNTGEMSRVAAQAVGEVIAVDRDPECIEILYGQARKNAAEKILPLVMDLSNPSPALGWNSEERMSFIQRAPSDLVLAFALVHHLAIGGNVPFSRIARFLRSISKHLVIEFVPKDDSQCQKLLKFKDSNFPWYTEKEFENAMGSCFEILKKTPILDSSRTLYCMRAV